MIDEFYRRQLAKYQYSEAWVLVNNWRSSTVEDLIVLDLGSDQLPTYRTAAENVAGRDGYVLVPRQGALPHAREIVFLARTPKALRKLYDKLRVGAEYSLVMSNDPAHIRVGYVESAEADKLTATASQVTYHLIMQPYKAQRRLSVYHIQGRGVIQHTGGLDTPPVIKLTGSGVATLSVNGIALRVSVPRTGLVIDSVSMDVRDGDGQLANSLIQGGFFPVLKSGKNSIALTGSVSADIEVNWRYLP